MNDSVEFGSSVIIAAKATRKFRKCRLSLFGSSVMIAVRGYTEVQEESKERNAVRFRRVEGSKPRAGSDLVGS